MPMRNRRIDRRNSGTNIGASHTSRVEYVVESEHAKQWRHEGRRLWIKTDRQLLWPRETRTSAALSPPTFEAVARGFWVVKYHRNKI